MSIIVCSRNGGLLKRCLASLKGLTDYPNWEIVIVQHTTGSDPALAQVVVDSKSTVAPYSGPFNFSRMNNLGAAASKGELLIFLNDDVEPSMPALYSA